MEKAVAEWRSCLSVLQEERTRAVSSLRAVHKAQRQASVGLPARRASRQLLHARRALQETRRRLLDHVSAPLQRLAASLVDPLRSLLLSAARCARTQALLLPPLTSPDALDATLMALAEVAPLPLLTLEEHCLCLQ